jgi:hypothetical protein
MNYQSAIVLEALKREPAMLEPDGATIPASRARPEFRGRVREGRPR